MTKKNKLTRDEKIYEHLYPYHQKSVEIFEAQRVFSRDPNKRSSLRERHALFLFDKFAGIEGAYNAEGNVSRIELADSAVINDTVVTDDPASSIPYLRVVWLSKETEDLGLLHNLFSKVREK